MNLVTIKCIWEAMNLWISSHRPSSAKLARWRPLETFHPSSRRHESEKLKSTGPWIQALWMSLWRVWRPIRPHKDQTLGPQGELRRAVSNQHFPTTVFNIQGANRTWGTIELAQQIIQQSSATTDNISQPLVLAPSRRHHWVGTPNEPPATSN